MFDKTAGRTEMPIYGTQKRKSKAPRTVILIAVLGFLTVLGATVALYMTSIQPVQPDQDVKAVPVAPNPVSMAQDPKVAAAHLTVGNIYLNAGQLEDAEKSFLKSLEASGGKDKGTHNLLGQTYLRMKDYGKAKESFLKAENEGKRGLAMVYYIQKDFDKARPLLEELVLKKPEDMVLAQMLQEIKGTN